MIRWAPDSQSACFPDVQGLSQSQDGLPRLPRLHASRMKNKHTNSSESVLRRWAPQTCPRREQRHLRSHGVARRAPGTKCAPSGIESVMQKRDSTAVPLGSCQPVMAQTFTSVGSWRKLNFWDDPSSQSHHSQDPGPGHTKGAKGNTKPQKSLTGSNFFQFGFERCEKPNFVRLPCSQMMKTGSIPKVGSVGCISSVQRIEAKRVVQPDMRATDPGRIAQAPSAESSTTSQAQQQAHPSSPSVPRSRSPQPNGDDRLGSKRPIASPAWHGAEKPSEEDFGEAIARLRSTGGKPEEWFIAQLQLLQDEGIPPGVEALRRVIGRKCGSLAHGFAKLDYNGNGELSLLEFAGGLALLFPPLCGQSSVKLLTGMTERQLFRSFDHDNNGTISIRELAGEDIAPIRESKRMSTLKQINFDSIKSAAASEQLLWKPKRSTKIEAQTRQHHRKLEQQRNEESVHGSPSPRNDVSLNVSPLMSPKGSVSVACPRMTRGSAMIDILGSPKRLSPLSPRSPASPASPLSRATHAAGEDCGDVCVLMAQWTTLLARQKVKRDSSPGRTISPRISVRGEEEDEESQDEEDITTAVDHAEKMMQKVFNGSCEGYMKRNEYLMTRPKFFAFFSELTAGDIVERKLHTLYDSQLELQRDLTMATAGVAITEGLNYDSFRVCLHRAAVQMKLSLHHVVSDLVQDYESRATAQVASWKRQRKKRK